jgi:5'-nucleotidase
LKEALAQYRAALALARNDPDLEETVAQLARQVEPQKPAIPPDGLSFDQMESELLKLAPRPTVPAAVAPAAQVAPPPPEPAPATSAAHVAPPPPPPAPSPIPIAEPADVAEVEVAPPIEEPVPSEAELEHAARTVAALEQWLDAIHVTRADRRA